MINACMGTAAAGMERSLSVPCPTFCSLSCFFRSGFRRGRLFIFTRDCLCALSRTTHSRILTSVITFTWRNAKVASRRRQRRRRSSANQSSISLCAGRISGSASKHARRLGQKCRGRRQTDRQTGFTLRDGDVTIVVSVSKTTKAASSFLLLLRAVHGGRRRQRGCGMPTTISPRPPNSVARGNFLHGSSKRGGGAVHRD